MVTLEYPKGLHRLKNFDFFLSKSTIFPIIGFLKKIDFKNFQGQRREFQLVDFIGSNDFYLGLEPQEFYASCIHL